ncbi:acetyltransferase [Colletotrichum graminicola]|uniref:Acetyltransferase n=1 Tax=Colletotrichum graminicola (strain M1.001 / M2 / FGSC 10212) TaxID=645133 RepID=E3QSS3_COLGM|nr:acetyltransferase [Colletotrichum graminicola M1.001]EFQ33911.1 acetyltransferase [Colletotrichum graminicola M1.001]WDK21102.1 acetyltransferase [Colletotrichum graminicola]
MAPSQDLPAPILTLEKCLVRPYYLSDAPALARAADSKTVVTYLRNRFPHPYTLADSEGWIAMNQTPPIFNWAIVCPTSGTAMGSIGLIPGEDVYSSSYELGYWIGEEFWGRGVMSELVPAFVSWVFSGMSVGSGGVERVWAGVFSENAASQRVLEKSGFVFEGRLRRAIMKKGVCMDELRYSVVRTDLQV